MENPDYAAFAGRVIGAHGRRVGGDVEASPIGWRSQGSRETAARVAVDGLRQHGCSWAEIAARLGLTRQAVQQR